jgi:hypothetical protein
MEFVVVTFSNTRSVNVDGAPRGQTGQLLRLQAGTHNFDLGTPLDYAPVNVMTPVRGTTAAAPMVIAFMPRATATRKKPARKSPPRKRAKKRSPIRKAGGRKGAKKKA